MESEMDLIRMDYKRKLISQIGINIKTARQTDETEYINKVIEGKTND